jgi:hypothetical protein
MSGAADCPVVGHVPFADGVTRDVYEDADGRQWVVGYDGERVYGVWLMPADEPTVIAGGGPDKQDPAISSLPCTGPRG